MAAADRIEITIDGKGDGAHPHAAIDPRLAGHIITAAQSVVSRNVNPIDTAVEPGAMHAGHPGAMSVIPAHAASRDRARSAPPRRT